MRVKIAYSADIEDIPREVCKLIQALSINHEGLIDRVVLNLEEDSVDSAIENIDKVRQEMYQVDQRLADCSAILQGYIKTKYTPPPDTSEMQDTLEGIEQQLEDMGAEIENDPAS
tara:strand:+ start:416 stop:760 length:345 start_codon:yes stop_codon:yes gene_type:complete